MALMAKRSLFGEAAADMVRLCAFLAPDAIPEAIFTSYRFDQSDTASAPDMPGQYDAICAAVVFATSLS